ncbi:RbsD/FucU family protein [Actinomyces sp. B33]|uniref:RbsD/FucU family protein n=1 Tax=Actinomyces sp. B33 TaxID=2942131 RepID=UPI00233FE35B|nr:RbsD/FucU family protein [Actinomyces sp. B33]MDC4232113.1 RbsD/FucU family protein [Actinomyces sp. B33]
MLYGPMTHPQFLRALAAAGHGSKILLADANYPHTTGVSQRCELVSLNYAPGMLDVLQVLEVLKRTIPIEKAEIMVPAPDAEQVEIPIHDEFRSQLPDIEFGELSRFDFYDAARGEDVGIVVATGEQRLYGNLLLTVGVRQPGE